MNVFVFGTRGFPNIQGGVEEHCENLYSEIGSEQFQVTVFRRKPYVSQLSVENRNISFIDLPSSELPGFETLFHSSICTIICLIKRPDIIHIHNIGPGIFIPILKIFRLKVVLTYHSPNYEHDKWSLLVKKLLKFAEFVSIAFSDAVIFVSKFQKEKLKQKKKYIQINNGVNPPKASDDDNYIRTLGLRKRKYLFALGRFVEEKGFDLLIHAFKKTKFNDLKLVIAGDADQETAYSKQLKLLANSQEVILPGFIKGEKLHQLFKYSRLFVLPSYHEGLPISLLEAMSYNLPVLVSDIPANKQIALPENNYFISGNEKSLNNRLKQRLNQIFEPADYDMTPYDWSKVAIQTKNVYNKVLKKESAIPN